MFGLRANRFTNKSTLFSRRYFGIFRDVFGSVRNSEGKLETAEERLNKGWKSEEERINDKYFKLKSNPNSIYYYSIQYLNKLEKDLMSENPAARSKLKQ